MFIIDTSPAWCIRRFLNTLRQRQNGRHFPDAIFKWTFLNENVWILIKISLKFVPKGLINNIPALFQIMAWRRSGDKPLSEVKMVNSLTHICVTRPQWVKTWGLGFFCVCFFFFFFNSLMPYIWWHRSGSELLVGTKPSPEPMLIYHQRSWVAFTWEHYHKKCTWT